MATDPPSYLRLYRGDDEPDDRDEATADDPHADAVVGAIEDLRDAVSECDAIESDLQRRIELELDQLLSAPESLGDAVLQSAVWSLLVEAHEQLAAHPAESALLFERIGDVVSLVSGSDPSN